MTIDVPDEYLPLIIKALDNQHVASQVCARWTVRLVAEEAVKRRLVPRVGRETIRVLLLHHDLKPWREKNVVVRRDEPAWS
jgi:hypothetical protein